MLLNEISFFRYADRPNAYWTGYFTSRPALKGYVRLMSGYYAVRSLASSSSLQSVSFCRLNIMDLFLSFF